MANPTPIPWASTGRQTIAWRVTQSLLPVGILPFEPHPPDREMQGIGSDNPDMEKYLMRIMGTAIQVGDGKLLTTGETIEAVRPNQTEAFVLAHIERQNVRLAVPYPIPHAFRFIDPRTKKVNPTIDVALLLVPAKSYPLGTDLFLEYRSNRGFIQPTVYSGTIGAIIPAIQPTDTRLFRITVPGIGGISGGAVFSPRRGELLGMVTTSMHAAALPQPVIYAIPSEVLRPYVESVTFTRE